MRTDWNFIERIVFAFTFEIDAQILKTSLLHERSNKKVFRKIIKETPSKLSTKALKRANKINKLNAGTPHDWEDYEKYLKEEAENKNKT